MFFFFIFVLRIRFGHITGAANPSVAAPQHSKSLKLCDLKENGCSLDEKENIDINTLSAPTCTDPTDLMVWGVGGGGSFSPSQTRLLWLYSLHVVLIKL